MPWHHRMPFLDHVGYESIPGYSTPLWYVCTPFQVEHAMSRRPKRPVPFDIAVDILADFTLHIASSAAVLMIPSQLKLPGGLPDDFTPCAGCCVPTI
jgi:hypothetical protein